MFFKAERVAKHPAQAAFLLLFTLCILISGSTGIEVIDRIVAIVNDEVITLTDVNIVEKFGLFEDLVEIQEEGGQKIILDRLIYQKLVIQMTSERIVVDEEELEANLSDLIQKMLFYFR